MVKHSRGIWALNNKPLAWQVGAACEDVTRVKYIDLRNAILKIIFGKMSRVHTRPRRDCQMSRFQICD